MDKIKKEHKKHIVLSLIGVVVIGILAWSAQIFLGGEAAAINSIKKDYGNVPVEKVLDNKIVYTSDASYPTEVLEEDCNQRGGDFNSCGGLGDNDSDSLICSYTCEF